MEKFLEGVVATMDFLIYKPLYYFLNSNDELRPLIKKIERIQAVIRMFLIQRKMNQVSPFLSTIHPFVSCLDPFGEISGRYSKIDETIKDWDSCHGPFY
jgi:hypothetical protein